jgi:hypothetical protein
MQWQEDGLQVFRKTENTHWHWEDFTCTSVYEATEI